MCFFVSDACIYDKLILSSEFCQQGTCSVCLVNKRMSYVRRKVTDRIVLNCVVHKQVPGLWLNVPKHTFILSLQVQKLCDKQKLHMMNYFMNLMLSQSIQNMISQEKSAMQCYVKRCMQKACMCKITKPCHFINSSFMAFNLSIMAWNEYRFKR